MVEPTPKTIGIAVLDQMIARAEAACDRVRTKRAGPRKAYYRARTKLAINQQTMEDILARLRARKAAAGHQADRQGKGAARRPKGSS